MTELSTLEKIALKCIKIFHKTVLCIMMGAFSPIIICLIMNDIMDEAGLVKSDDIELLKHYKQLFRFIVYFLVFYGLITFLIYWSLT